MRSLHYVMYPAFILVPLENFNFKYHTGYVGLIWTTVKFNV